MPTNLLLLPLLGGYWFLHTLYYTRFRSQRLDGYRLLMESAFAGLLLTLVARVVVLFAQRWPLIQSAWSDLAPGIPFLGTTAVEEDIENVGSRNTRQQTASIRMASFFDQAAYPAFIVEAGEPQPESPTIS